MSKNTSSEGRIPSRFLHNLKLREEVLDRLRNDWPNDRPNWSEVSTRLAERFGVFPGLATSHSKLPTPPADFAAESVDMPGLHLEAIILPIARPVLFVQDNDFTSAPLQYWQERLDSARQVIKRAILAVGRVELKDHDLFDWCGTAWLVRSNVAVTNAHVARTFAAKDSQGWVFRANSSGKKIGSRIDYREEYERSSQEERPVVEILYIEEGDGPDIAFLKVQPDQAREYGLNLAARVAPNTEVVTIGYPKYDTSIPDPDLLVSIFGGIYDVKRLSPGVVTQTTPTFLHHDCSTLGGSSGSAVVDLESGNVAGLHFGGTYKISNLAVPAPVICGLLARLGI